MLKSLPAMGSRKNPFRFWPWLALGLAAAGSGCGRKADLLPDPQAVSAAYCQRDGEGRLLITIENRGKRESKATTTEVVFDALPPIRLPTRPISPKSSASVAFRIPDSCFQPECRFTISTDVKDEVAEVDENNNSVVGTCPR